MWCFKTVFNEIFFCGTSWSKILGNYFCTFFIEIAAGAGEEFQLSFQPKYTFLRHCFKKSEKHLNCKKLRPTKLPRSGSKVYRVVDENWRFKHDKKVADGQIQDQIVGRGSHARTSEIVHWKYFRNENWNEMLQVVKLLPVKLFPQSKA